MDKENRSRYLFHHEEVILDHSLQIIDSQQYRNNVLLPEYEMLTKEYEKLLKVTQRTFRISDMQEKHLKQREEDIKSLLDNSSQGFLTFGSDLLVDKEHSKECVRIFNKKIVRANIIELLCEANQELSRLFLEIFAKLLNAPDSETALALIAKLPGMLKINGKDINIEYKLVETEGALERERTVMLILTDITEKRHTEDHVFFLSFHDSLTSLYNRAYVKNILPQFQLESSLPLSVIMADMNGLKLTNDIFGHESGDRLLVNISQVFLRCCRKNDIVARWGGDEFLLILPGADTNACQKICARIKATCGKVAADPIELSVSMGFVTGEDTDADLESLINAAENMMYSNKIIESRAIKRKILLDMGETLPEKCFEDSGHIHRVKSLTIKFAVALGVSPDSKEWNDLMLLVQLHDIGKVAIPREILGKAGPLSCDEWKIMRSYPEIGYRMVQGIGEPAVAQGILAIREHYDGKGYPYGLSAKNIPLIARIVSIVDSYDVMLHDRPYQKKRSRSEAIHEIRRSASTQFDSQLVEVFLNNIVAWSDTDDHM